MTSDCGNGRDQSGRLLMPVVDKWVSNPLLCNQIHLSVRYRIKSETEAYERNVPESQLTSDVGPEGRISPT